MQRLARRSWARRAPCELQAPPGGLQRQTVWLRCASSAPAAACTCPQPALPTYISPCPSSELQQQAGAYVLRRTQDILTRHLPPLSTFTLFVQPSDLQVRATWLQINTPPRGVASNARLCAVCRHHAANVQGGQASAFLARTVQVSLYRSVLKSKAITQLLYGGGGSDEGALPAITVLKKVLRELHPDCTLGMACCAALQRNTLRRATLY